MKLLFDQNLSFRLCADIADLFPGSTHVRLLQMAQADDLAIWEYAKSNGYTIVSQDADFAEMAMIFQSPPKVVWVRTGNRPSAVISAALRLHATLIVALETDEAVCLEIY